MTDYMQNARPLRDLHGYSQAYVAFKVGVSQSLYCKAENGQIRPTIDLIERICTLYGISMADFLGKTRQDLTTQIMDSEVYRNHKVNRLVYW